MSRDVEGERGVEREGSEKRVREREREEGRQVVPHGVPRYPTMRGCGPRVEREGERGMKRADGMRRKGGYRGSRRGRRYMRREQERAREEATRKKRDGETKWESEETERTVRDGQRR